MPDIGAFDGLTGRYGFAVGLLLSVISALVWTVRKLWSENQALHSKLIELLDQRGKFLDSILTEAINGKSRNRNS